jgi:hypothetical protein
LKHVYLDASALVKRFRHELGSEVVNDTVERVSADDARRLVVSALTTSETLLILNRRRNEAHIPLSVFILSLRGVIRELKSFSPGSFSFRDLCLSVFSLPLDGGGQGWG